MKLKIGISSPILVEEFKDYITIPNANFLKLGLGGHAVNRLVLGLLERGVHVEIFTLDRSIKQNVKLHGDLLTINLFPLRGKIRGLDVFKKEIVLLKESINNSDVDIVHAHWSYEYALAALKSDKPHLITVRDNAKAILKNHNDKLYRLLRYFMNKYVIKNSDNVIANSDYIKKYLDETFRLDVDVIPNPIDDKELDNNARVYNTSRKHIVSVNNGFSKLKNVKLLIIAFFEVRKKIPECELLLIGNQYGENEEAQSWAKKEGFDNGIKFFGKKINDEVLEIIGSADLLVHPSLEESFGNPLIEAMSKGTPCIGGEDSGAIPWVLDYGKAGLLVDVRSPNEISDGILKILNNKKTWEEYSSKGIKNVGHRFILPVVLDQHINKYKEICHK